MTTSTVHAGDEDPSIHVLVEDFMELVQVVCPDPLKALFLPPSLFSPYNMSPSPAHWPMGDSVVVRTCPVLLEHKYRVTGVAVIDVVEGAKLGSAIEALPHMPPRCPNRRISKCVSRDRVAVRITPTP